MTPQTVMEIGRQALEVTLLVSAPLLMAELIVGLIVSIFQAATQINDSSLAFIPKIAAAVVGLAFFGHFMLNRIANFTVWVYGQIANIAP